MKNAFNIASTTIALCTSLFAAKYPVVGGKEMYPTKDIVENAVNSADHTTLVAAVKAAGSVKTLEGKGPFTVFAPTNEAFNKLPAGTVDTLLKPENKAKLRFGISQLAGVSRKSSRKLDLRSATINE